MFSFRSIIGNKKNKAERSIQSLQELFTCNLKYLPDTTFEKEAKNRIINGKYYTVYTKKLRKKECGLFDVIEVRMSWEYESKCVTFISDDTTDIDMEALRIFVNACYSLYGADDSDIQRGKFDQEDTSSILKQTWKGRTWIRDETPRVILRLGVHRLEVMVKP